MPLLTSSTQHTSACPLALWRYIQPTEKGSKRPRGPRKDLWAATLVLAVASLEAGLEELVLSAHGHRLGTIGNPLTKKLREALVEGPLMTPTSAKIDHVLISQFGLELGALPSAARFEARHKDWAKGGSSLGTPRWSPRTWSDLKQFLDALMHIRNGTAHGDVVKLRHPPRTAVGYLWLTTESGGWSIQQPHALTGLRTVVAVFNAVADALDQELGLFAAKSSLRSADRLFAYDKGDR